MPDYRSLYFKLFAALADAVDTLDRGDCKQARQQLIRAQQQAEEEYIAQEDAVQELQ